MTMKCSAFIFLISSLLFFGLTFYYLSTLTSVPDVTTGAIYPLNSHGWVVYLNRPQNLLLKWLERLAFISGLTSVFIKYWEFIKRTVVRARRWVAALPRRLQE
jgi:hypothetical protein